MMHYIYYYMYLILFFLSGEDKDSELSPESDTSSEESIECRNVEVKLTVKINELQSKNHQLEELECSFRSEVERLQLKAQEKDEEVRRMAAERDSMERELQDALTQKQVIIVTWRESVKGKWEVHLSEKGACWFTHRYLKE